MIVALARAKARLISASCRITSQISAADRPGHTGSPAMRTCWPACLSMKARNSGMIRAGLRPTSAMSAHSSSPG